MEVIEGEDGWLKINGETVAEVKSWKLSVGHNLKDAALMPEIYVVRKAGLFRKPILWLMMPEIIEPYRSFQVGEFRDWHSAELARDRLIEELKERADVDESS